jgi:hypothetical protein
MFSVGVSGSTGNNAYGYVYVGTFDKNPTPGNNTFVVDFSGGASGSWNSEGNNQHSRVYLHNYNNTVWNSAAKIKFRGPNSNTWALVVCSNNDVYLRFLQPNGGGNWWYKADLSFYGGIRIPKRNNWAYSAAAPANIALTVALDDATNQAEFPPSALGVPVKTFQRNSGTLNKDIFYYVNSSAKITVYLDSMPNMTDADIGKVYTFSAGCSSSPQYGGFSVKFWDGANDATAETYNSNHATPVKVVFAGRFNNRNAWVQI